MRFAAASLRTYLAGDAIRKTARFHDLIKIEGATIKRWNVSHLAHLSFLERERADIIVAHRAPFLGSVHDNFPGDVLNSFFVNNLNPKRSPKTKLWIHRHMHPVRLHQASR